MESIILNQLNKLERDKIIQIGVHQFLANKLWSNNSMYGKILNILSLIFIIISIILLFYNFIWFINSVIFLSLYSFAVTKIAAMATKVQVLKDEYLLKTLYSMNIVNIKVRNETNRIIEDPLLLDNEIIKLYKETYG